MSLKRISLETAKLLDESGLLISSHVEVGIIDLPFYYYCPEYSNGKEKLLDYDYGVATNIERNGYKTYGAPTLVEMQMEFRKYYDVDIYVAPYHEHIEEDDTYEKHYNVSMDFPSRPTEIYSGFDTYEEALEIGIQRTLELVYSVDLGNEVN